MAKDKQFKFYENFMRAIDTLPEEQRAVACYKFCKFGIYGELPEDEALKMFCIGVSVSVQKYQNCGGNHNPLGNNQHKKIGQVGQVGQKEQTKTETKTKTKTETKTETEIKFKPPTIDKVEQYCQERKNNINPLSFISYYQSVGWKVGRNKMKDWKAAIRTWEQKNKQNSVTEKQAIKWDY